MIRFLKESYDIAGYKIPGKRKDRSPLPRAPVFLVDRKREREKFIDQ